MLRPGRQRGLSSAGFMKRFAHSFENHSRKLAMARRGGVRLGANGLSVQREASRAQRFKSIFNCLSSAMC
jgi:hypothetical protein